MLRGGGTKKGKFFGNRGVRTKRIYIQSVFWISEMKSKIGQKKTGLTVPARRVNPVIKSVIQTEIGGLLIHFHYFVINRPICNVNLHGINTFRQIGQINRLHIFYIS